MTKHICVLLICLLVCLLAAGCGVDSTSEKSSDINAIAQTTESKTPEISSTDETTEIAAITDGENARWFTSYTDRAKIYNIVDELSNTAELIIEGDCVEANPVYKLNMLYTLSKIEVTAVHKGDVNIGDTIMVVEIGGRTNFKDYDANCNTVEKDFEANGERLSDDCSVVFGVDGFYPLKAGEKVLLFLGDTSGFLDGIDDALYGIVGDYDGKLYAQGDGTYKRPSPGENDSYCFDDDTLTVTVDELED